MIYKELAKELVNYQFVLLKKNNKDNNSLDLIKGQKWVIGYLIEVEDGIHPSKLCEFMGVSTARIAKILNALEKQSLIKRRVCSTDKRKIIVNLTDKGRDLGFFYQKEFVDDLSKMLKKLGEKDAKEYVRLTKKVMNISLEN